MSRTAALLLGAFLACTGLAAAADDDPYLWLEDVEGARALDWVKAQNAISSKELKAGPGYAALHDRILSILDSSARIPDFTKRGDYLYNFWQDAQHVRGLWRRTTLAEFRKKAPAWETILDVDQLAATEKESWVFKGASCVQPAFDRCLVSLSRGGGDAITIREFDIAKKAFVADGFSVPEAKTEIEWRNRDSVYVGTDFGPGSLTDSGYPRVLKEWTRGTPLAAARTVFEGEPADVAVSGNVIDRAGTHHEVVQRATTFFTAQYWLRVGDQFSKLPVPDDAELDLHRERLYLRLRSDWKVADRAYASGSLLSLDLVSFLEGSRAFDVLFQPSPKVALDGYAFTRGKVILNELDNVRGRVEILTPGPKGWARESVPVPENGVASARPFDYDTSEQYLLWREDPVTPARLELGTPGVKARELLKEEPAYFDARDVQVTQHEATSRDGTKVPYFQVAKRGVKLDGTAPTVLYGYGGFEVPQLADYSATIGAAWIERGGVWVVANGRGGGEFGPQWHTSAILENRQRAFDDFIAIGESLVARKVTSPAHLGIMGGSNGGLLVGVAMTERPDLFGAVLCEAPLLDMKRYSHLLAGASWMAEYGDPDDPDQWAWISKYSPYQNVSADKHYPRVLFMTSTRDDRVHPGHARKMAALMEEQKHDVLFYENVEGGHAGAVNNEQRATMQTLGWVFLWDQLNAKGR